MATPTLPVRVTVNRRDNKRCVCCNATDNLTFQHRAATGMGGSKNRPAPVDGIVLCLTCNQACEADMQVLALAYGWKIRRWANARLVPVYYPHEFAWYRLEGTTRVPITSVVALELMHAVYGDEYMHWHEEVR